MYLNFESHAPWNLIIFKNSSLNTYSSKLQIIKNDDEIIRFKNSEPLLFAKAYKAFWFFNFVLYMFNCDFKNQKAINKCKNFQPPVPTI